jgi:signal transduction histidine kinase
MPVAHWGGATEQWEALRVLHLNHETLPTLLARLEREDLITTLSGDGDFLANALRRTLEITESVHLPLHCGGVLLGLQSIGYRTSSLPLPSVQQRIARGITHLASIALENARLFEQAESANRLKSDLDYYDSHELRTPLHIITGYNDLYWMVNWRGTASAN